MKKKMRVNLISLVIVFSLLFPLLSATRMNAGNMSFSDVKEKDWFYGDVMRLVNMGAIAGYGDGTFRPKDSITRAEFVKILVTSLKFDIVSWGSFPDTENHWSSDYISTAIAYRVIDEADYGDSFEPDKPISRLEMAKMLIRALKVDTDDVGKGPFEDISSKYTTTAYREHLITGSFTNGKRYFHPEDNTSRAEASAVIARAIDYNADPYGYKEQKEKEAKEKKKAELAAKNLPYIHSGKKPTQAQVLNLLREYDKDGYFILNETIKRKDDFMDWIDSDDFLDDIAVAVHEECHGYTNLTNNSIHSKVFYLGNGKSVTVKLTDVFYTREMASSIPEKLRTFRFSTYVGDAGKNAGSNFFGVYGLLDEFTAYYYGTKTRCNLYDYYMTYAQSAYDWFDYIRDVQSHYFSYAEFRYYILKYLIYAKDHYKSVYDSIMANREFKTVFNTIDQKFNDLIQDYFNKRKDLVEYLQGEGYNAYMDESWFGIENMSIGITYDDTYHLLMTEMEKEEYQEILRQLKG